MNNDNLIWKIFWIIIFGISMGFAEAAVVVYLRAIFYPEGFSFPLKTLTDYKILVEVFREAATIFMLLSVAFFAGRRLWERVGYFILSFGIWDIFYYIWLKVLIDWPSSILDWDILFLIPLPWVGPVIAPVSIAVLFIIFGGMALYGFSRGRDFKPSIISLLFSMIGAFIILYSFMYDTDATLHQQFPKPYRYELLIAGEVIFIAVFINIYRKDRKGY